MSKEKETVVSKVVVADNTVVTAEDVVKKAIDDIKKGRVEYRTDSYGNVHAIIGKVSFDADKLVENLDAFVNVIIKSKPSTVKGQYLKNISVAPTMGPGIKIDLSSFDK